MAKKFTTLFAAFFLVSLMPGINMANAQVQKTTLDNSYIHAVLTPDIGGRVLEFSLLGQPNFLRVGEAVASNPDPAVTPESSNVAYLGHEIWVGPQSEWWIHQELNSERAGQKAVWPPDPYLILAKNIVLEQKPGKVVFQSPESPVSGVQLTKTYELIPDKPDSFRLSVTMKNIRRENIAWDIWFNTRVPSSVQVYVPVHTEQDVKVNDLADKQHASLSPTYAEGFLSLDMTSPGQDKTARKGKLMIQPCAGWMAAFQDKQVFIVQFRHQQGSVIHPAQGQIELYSEFDATNLHEGLLEMEVHSPYKKLAPGETVHAEEIWTMLKYDGPATRQAQLAFLNKHRKQFEKFSGI